MDETELRGMGLWLKYSLDPDFKEEIQEKGDPKLMRDEKAALKTIVTRAAQRNGFTREDFKDLHSVPHVIARLMRKNTIVGDLHLTDKEIEEGLQIEYLEEGHEVDRACTLLRTLNRKVTVRSVREKLGNGSFSQLTEAVRWNKIRHGEASYEGKYETEALRSCAEST